MRRTEEVRVPCCRKQSRLDQLPCAHGKLGHAKRTNASKGPRSSRDATSLSSLTPSMFHPLMTFLWGPERLESSAPTCRARRTQIRPESASLVAQIARRPTSRALRTHHLPIMCQWLDLRVMGKGVWGVSRQIHAIPCKCLKPAQTTILQPHLGGFQHQCTQPAAGLSSKHESRAVRFWG